MLDVNRERLAGYRRCQAFGGRKEWAIWTHGWHG